MKKYIEFLMLTPETAHEYTITVPADTTAEELAEHLMPLMKKSVVSDISVKEVTTDDQYDECVELVFNNTDPCKTLNEADAEQIIAQLKDKGYTIPEMLTPELFVEIYNGLEPENENT